MSRNPSGGARTAWFVRSRGRHGRYMIPASFAGWAISVLYSLVVIAVTFVFVADGNPPGSADLIAWGTIFAAATFLFLITSYRTSVTAEPRAKGESGCSW